ncbi:unannotated protein [freshwater metagenome]|uniref:Unannotated protein n=1 Tax=freshwater metagenome TaxID=449393 RepID=A0A6J7CM51_9ZZZZ
MVHEDVARADRREDVATVVVRCTGEGRGIHGLEGLVAQVGMSREPHDLPEIVEIEQPGDGVDLPILDAQRSAELIPDRGTESLLDLKAHDLAERPPTQLRLHRLEQVVGLIGDLEVRVARHAEEPVIEDLHPREKRVEVLGDQLLEQHEGRLALDHRDEAGEHLLRYLHARKDGDRSLRVAHEHREAQRKIRDVWERATEADGERREDGEHLLTETLAQLRQLIGRDVGERTQAQPVLGEDGPQLAADEPRLAIDLRLDLRAQDIDRFVGVEPPTPLVGDAGLDLIVQARDADHEELIEIR